jgi:hypothetical protein
MPPQKSPDLTDCATFSRLSTLSIRPAGKDGGLDASLGGGRQPNANLSHGHAATADHLRDGSWRSIRRSPPWPCSPAQQSLNRRPCQPDCLLIERADLAQRHRRRTGAASGGGCRRCRAPDPDLKVRRVWCCALLLGARPNAAQAQVAPCRLAATIDACGPARRRADLPR